MAPLTNSRGPLMDITRANNIATPRKSIGSKRAAPSPFTNPYILPSSTGQRVRRRTNPVLPALDSTSVVKDVTKELSADNNAGPLWGFSSGETSLESDSLALLNSEPSRIETMTKVWETALGLPTEYELQALQIRELQAAVNLANVERRYRTI